MWSWQREDITCSQTFKVPDRSRIFLHLPGRRSSFCLFTSVTILSFFFKLRKCSRVATRLREFEKKEFSTRDICSEFFAHTHLAAGSFIKNSKYFEKVFLRLDVAAMQMECGCKIKEKNKTFCRKKSQHFYERLGFLAFYSTKFIKQLLKSYGNKKNTTLPGIVLPKSCLFLQKI